MTLSEWAKFCADNPHYLTVSTPTVNSLTFTVNQGIGNIKDITGPLDLLKDKLAREQIIKHQKVDFKDLYNDCLNSPNFEVKTDKDQYQINFDLLMINKDGYKILVPDNLIGPLLAYTHLLGHMGTYKMINNISVNYYFENIYTVCKRFCSCCYGCFMNHGSSRCNKIGTYPLPEYPLEEISVNLAGSLYKIKGYSHLMIVQDVLSDYLMVFPLKSKTANKISNVFLYSILQHFNIAKNLHSDNATCFRHKDLLKLWAAV